MALPDGVQKGHRDVENAARAAEKNGPNVFAVCQDEEDI